MGPSLGNAQLFWPLTYLLALGSAWILHLHLRPVCPTGSGCPGAGPMPCSGTVTCHCPLSLRRGGWCRAGTGVLWAAFVPGQGLWGSHEDPGSSGQAGLAWWPSWVFQAVISAWWHPFSQPSLPLAFPPPQPQEGLGFPQAVARVPDLATAPAQPGEGKAAQPRLLCGWGSRLGHLWHLSGQQALQHRAG